MDRELTYQIPFERLRKLGRRSGRKAYPKLWTARWVVLGLFFGSLLLVSTFGDEVERWQAEMGLPSLTVLVVIIGAGLAAIVFLRRAATSETKARANFDADIRMRKDAGGVHFATDEIEYYLKWPGISQMLMEPDGVVLSHASFFFLVPDRAFADMAERNAFVRDVYARLGAEARQRSEQSLRPVLNATADQARS